MFCDWEYDVDLSHWDRPVNPDEIAKRLIAMSDVNSNKNAVQFHWVFFLFISYIARSLIELGYPRSKITQWVHFDQDFLFLQSIVQAYKNLTHGRSFVLGTDLVWFDVTAQLL